MPPLPAQLLGSFPLKHSQELNLAPPLHVHQSAECCCRESESQVAGSSITNISLCALPPYIPISYLVFCSQTFLLLFSHFSAIRWEHHHLPSPKLQPHSITHFGSKLQFPIIPGGVSVPPCKAISCPGLWIHPLSSSLGFCLSFSHLPILSVSPSPLVHCCFT